MRRENAYLRDILQAIDRSSQFIDGMTKDDFLADEKTQAAVARQIEVVGEAASRLPESFRSEHSSVPWQELIQLRNFYIHAYHAIDYSRAWRSATVTLPSIRNGVQAILDMSVSGKS